MSSAKTRVSGKEAVVEALRSRLTEAGIEPTDEEWATTLRAFQPMGPIIQAMADELTMEDSPPTSTMPTGAVR